MPELVSFREHIFKNLSLISLSILFLPLDTFILAACLVWQGVRPFIFQKPSPPISYNAQQRTVLVSSISMGKGLSLARSFYRAGHRAIGVDFDTAHFAHSPVPSSGRFSNVLNKYYTVTTPNDEESRARYAAEMVSLVKKEGVDLWVCVSGVASTAEDALLKDVIEKETRCKVFQPDPKTCDILHDKHEFIRIVDDAGLKTPVTVLVESHEGVFKVLREHLELKFILKCVELDDVSRADMTQLPRPTPLGTERFIRGLEISPKKRWVVQEFIQGAEFCTHAVVVRGKVQAFVACPSAEMLMHYEALAAESPLSKAMLAFTRRLTKTLEGGKMTGQVSFDFLVDVKDASAKDLKDIKLFPIECNPRTHTAVVLLAEQQPRQLANAYLSLLDEPELLYSKTNRGKTLDDTDISTVVRPSIDKSSRTSFYWIGHDFVVDVVLPVLHMITLEVGPLECTKSVFWFFVRVFVWKEATFEVWDPLPWWWLYHVYYPWIFATSLATGKRWSRVNVSTTRVFESY
jgi:catechol O-methyltransferase